MISKPLKHKYRITTLNGRVKVYIDEILFLAFNQIDFKGLNSFKDDTNLYGVGILLMSQESSSTATLRVYFKSKQVWIEVLKLLDDYM